MNLFFVWNLIYLPLHHFVFGFFIPESQQWLDSVENEEKTKISDLFSSRLYLKRIFLCLICWSVTNVVYFGFSMNVASLSGNVYLNMIMSGVVDFFGYSAIPLIFAGYGRIKTQLSTLFMLLCIPSFAALFIPTQYQTLLSILRWTGKLGSSALFSVIYIHAPEMFPTPVQYEYYS